MFTGVCLSTGGLLQWGCLLLGGVWCLVLGGLLPGGCLVPGGSAPGGVSALGGGVPGGDPPRWLLLRAVCILLECILVLLILFSFFSYYFKLYNIVIYFIVFPLTYKADSFQHSLRFFERSYQHVFQAFLIQCSTCPHFNHTS